MEASKPHGLEVVPYSWRRRRAQAHKGEAAVLKQVSHKVEVQVHLEVDLKEEILKASFKGEAPRVETRRLRNAEEASKNNKMAVANPKVGHKTIPRVEFKTSLKAEVSKVDLKKRAPEENLREGFHRVDPKEKKGREKGRQQEVFLADNKAKSTHREGMKNQTEASKGRF